MPFSLFIPVAVLAQGSDWKATPYAEARLRYERRLDRDFLKANADNRTDLPMRLRAGVNAKHRDGWFAGAQYQLAHDWEWRPIGANSTTRSDMAEFFFGRSYADGLKWTAGRTHFNYGSQRLIGSGDWTVQGRSFDGLTAEKGNLSAFALRPSTGTAYNARLFGVSFKHNLGTTAFIHGYNNDTNVKVNTLHHAYAWDFSGLKFDFEGALQNGKVGVKDLESWALHLSATKALGEKTSAFVEYNAASGGNTPTKQRTFDNLFPTNHKFYGSMDLMSWRNMNEIAFGVSHQAKPNFGLKAHAHFFSLRDDRDAWYTAAGGTYTGTVPFIDPSGASGRDLGWELDIEGTYKWNANTTLMGGIGLFTPGRFVRNLVGANDKQTWLYFQLIRKL